MSNKFDEMRQTMCKAKSTISLADNCANAITEMLQGRLKKVHQWVLKRLKKELKDFNMHTQRWKN